jgi:predicted permease
MSWLTHTIADVQFSLRFLVRRLSYTATIVPVLAIGIGATLAALSLSKAFLSSRSGIRKPEALVSLFTSAPGARFGPASHPDFLDWQGADVFEDSAAHVVMPFSFRRSTQATVIWGEIATPNYFDMLGVEPHLGRFFAREKNGAHGTDAVVVLGFKFWQTTFSADRAVVGQNIHLNGASHTVVGVAPPAFRGLVGGLSASVWIPMSMAPQIGLDPARLEQRNARWLQVKARLKDGISADQGQAGLKLVSERLEREYPDTNRSRPATLVPFLEATIHPEVNRSMQRMARVLIGAVLLLLVVACINVAQLTVVRLDYRRKEIGIRMGIGASQGRLIAQLVTESMLVAAVAAIVGIVGSQLVLVGLERLLPDLALPLTLDTGLDLRQLLAAFGLAVLCGLLSVAGPALRMSRATPVSLMKSAEPVEARARWRPRLHSVLIGSQVALSVVLLASAGLFLRSLIAMRKLSPGFAEQRLAIVSVDTSLRGRRLADDYTLVERLIERSAALPGVRAVSAIDRMPLGFLGLLSVQHASVLLPGQSPPVDGKGTRIEYAVVAPGLFQTLKLPLLTGRDFVAADRFAAPLAIVNDAMAQKFWPGENVVGKMFSMTGAQGPYMEIVGVTANAKNRTLAETPPPLFYLPLSQQTRTKVDLVLATERDPAATVLEARRALHSVDPELGVVEAKTFAQHVDTLAYLPRAAAVLFSAVGLVAAVMASIATYGVLAFYVDRRKKEIGIRMALGAGPLDVARMVLRQVSMPATVGVLVGSTLGLATARVLTTFLYGGSGSAAWVGLGAVSALVALGISCTQPLATALRLNPVRNLKVE